MFLMNTLMCEEKHRVFLTDSVWRSSVKGPGFFHESVSELCSQLDARLCKRGINYQRVEQSLLCWWVNQYSL